MRSAMPIASSRSTGPVIALRNEGAAVPVARAPPLLRQVVASNPSAARNATPATVTFTPRQPT